MTNQTTRKLALRAAVAAMLVIGALTLAACSGGSSTQSAAPSDTTQQSASSSTQTGSTETSPETTAQPEAKEEATEVTIKDVRVGKGATAKAGDTVSVDYTGWLTDGTQFDTSIGKQPFTFTLGAGQVIQGWDKGVAGMKIGGTRDLVIPPALGYGEQGAGGVIPPNATLKFEVKLLSIQGK